MFVDAVLCSPLGLLTLKARAALGCHISAEVNRQASAMRALLRVAQSIPTQP